MFPPRPGAELSLSTLAAFIQSLRDALGVAEVSLGGMAVAVGVSYSNRNAWTYTV